MGWRPRHGVITAAAAIMVVVFGSFIGESDRIVSSSASASPVPCSSTRRHRSDAARAGHDGASGDANWWLPRWLDRSLPRVAVEGHPSRCDRPELRPSERPDLKPITRTPVMRRMPALAPASDAYLRRMITGPRTRRSPPGSRERTGFRPPVDDVDHVDRDVVEGPTVPLPADTGKGDGVAVVREDIGSRT